MIQHDTNRIVIQMAEESSAIEHIGFSLLSLPSKYPIIARPRRKRQLRLIREPRNRFPSRRRAKFTIHSGQRSAVNDDGRRDAAI
jgi:hypothetical protein